MFVAGGTAGINTIAYSVDGQTWTASTQIEIITSVNGIAYAKSSNTWVAVGLIFFLFIYLFIFFF